ncbi:DUF4442 domain-containing protein [Chitinophagaceae bacterium LWZ2-11]
MNPNFKAFKSLITHAVKYKAFLFTKLPMAYLAGLKVLNLTEEEATVSVKFKWLNQNPFRSIYFAVLSMAAELSTGILASGQVHGRTPSVSMLVVKVEGEFYKKAVGKIIFTCNDGAKIAAAVEETVATKEGVTCQATSIGKNEAGEDVAKFVLTWSFKSKV